MSKYKDMAMDKASGLRSGASNLKGGVKGKVTTSPHHSVPSAIHHLLRLPQAHQLWPPGSSTERIRGRLLLEAPPDEEEERPPSLPYRMNTTGLATNHLPPPPTRRAGANERSPPSYDSTTGTKRLPPPTPSPASSIGSGPSLPPRLPPRSNSQSPERISPLPAPGTLNQGAISRLGAAGISVPAFGIGSSKPSNDDASGPPKPPRPNAPQLNTLQNRFSKLGTSSTESVATPPNEGTSWAQKQAALKTASAFQKDPTSVSFADAKAAASTANNFRQRHGDQVVAGLNTANNLNQKYGVADKVGGFASQNSSARNSASSIATAASGVVGKKKPPPPPPKKKPSLVSDDTPPPVPLATRPTF
ncbi:hypothetical protein PT974_02805 [Cladobotryum mycophilum]|uniref:Gmp synthase n=1 Tax=Cladobotryum mycophilum TaxID=491253 RepID=A0ABR0T0A8_9HYPO